MITIATLQRNVILVEKFAQSQTKAANATLKTVSALEKQMRALEKNARLLTGNNIEVRLAKPVDNVNKKLKQTNNELDKIKNKAPKLFSGLNLSNLFAGYYLLTRVFSAIKSITDVADTAVSAKARIGLYNESKYTSDELYGAAYTASQRSRTSITDTTDLMNRILVSGAMTGPGAATESIRIAEIINKASIAGGGTREEVQRSLRQLAQGISSGALQGDELRSIREQTPFIAQMLAEGLNKVAPELGGNLAIGDLKALGAEGEITSERILKAFTAMEDEITKKFNQMPRTFSQSMTQAGNVFTKFISDLSKGGNALDKVNKIASEIADYLMSKQGQAMLARLGNMINSIAEGLYKVWSILSPIVAKLLESGPIIETLIASLGVLLGMGLASKLANFITSMGSMGKTGLYVAGVMLAVAAASTAASAAFQLMGDDSEEANKKVQAGWAAMVPAIMLVLNQIFWAVATGAAFVGDALLTTFSTVGNVLGIVLNSVIANVQKMGSVGAKIIDGLTNNKWDLSGKMENALNDTTGQMNKNWYSLTHQMESFNNTLGGGTSLHGMAIEQLNKGGAYWDDKTADAFMGEIERQDEFSKMFDDAKDFLDKVEKGEVKFNVGNVDNVKGTVDITSEDLKLLKDIASRDMLLNMASVTPQANVTFGDVRETADVGKIMDVIEDMVENAFATSLVSY